MTQIEVPDWVAAVALDAYKSSRGSYEGEVPPDLDDMRAALTAALGAWVVPEAWMAWHPSVNKGQKDPMSRKPSDEYLAVGGQFYPLYALRQEKPE